MKIEGQFYFYKISKNDKYLIAYLMQDPNIKIMIPYQKDLFQKNIVIQGIVSRVKSVNGSSYMFLESFKVVG
jgi:hypothetical protein